MKAHQLNENDKARDIFLAGLANRMFKTMNKKGDKFLYKEVEDVYPHSKNEKNILGAFGQEGKKEAKEDLYEMQARLQQAKELVAQRKGGN
ncbi:hypothetical protein [Enterococcus sp. AZ126]|uniref:hypothetical protein n=1 Tax=Enterococcus sp. AZ126 TaxID=2774635 RepID=UPI003F25F394